MTENREKGGSDVNLNYLKYFIEICDSGSIAAAANALYISRQSLTSAINNLETELGGVRLLVRSSTGIETTRAGKFFYEKAKEQVALYESTLEQLHQFDRRSMISIGAPLFCISEESMKSILAFEKKHLPIMLQCQDMTYRHSRQRLLNGTLNVGMVYRSASDSKFFRYFPICDADFCILGRADSAIASMEEVHFSDLKGACMLFVYGLEYISREPEKEIIDNNITIQCIPRNQSVLISSLKAGKGYHILPRLFTGMLLSDGIVSRPFVMFNRKQQLCFACLRDAEKPVIELGRHAAQVLAQINR